MKIPDDPNETPTLRIAEYTKDDKKRWEKSLDDWNKDMKASVCMMLKTPRGSDVHRGKPTYWVGEVPYTPDYSGQILTLVTLPEERPVDGDLESDGSCSDSEEEEEEDPLVI